MPENAPPVKRRLGRKIAIALGIVIVLIVAVNVFVAVNIANQDRALNVSERVPATDVSNQNRERPILNPVAPANVSNPNRERSSSRVAIRETGTVAYDGDKKMSWTCAPTTDALDEVLQWITKGDETEARRVSLRTQSIRVTSGQKVKILDSGFATKKVRVLSAADGQVWMKDEKGWFSADPRIGRECWVVAEAVQR